MPKFRKKPVVIEAMQFTGNNATEIQLFVGKKLEVNVPPHSMQVALNDIPDEAFTIIIPTLEGDMTAYRMDWIIKGVKGEFYPCKPDIFDQTYELVPPNLCNWPQGTETTASPSTEGAAAV